MKTLTTEIQAPQPKALRDQEAVAFPPGGAMLALPRYPRRALHAGLALFDDVTPRQRAAMATGRILARTGLASAVLPDARPQDLDWNWIEEWIATVAQPAVGVVAHIAVRLPPNGRLCLLLIGPDGQPVGFAKLTDAALSPMSAVARAALAAQPLESVTVPRTLREGVHDGRHYILFSPMPTGPNRRPPSDHGRIHAIASEITERLSVIPRGTDVPADHVVGHSGFTPRNLRVAADGTWWLFDWDYVRWGPRVAPELRYWCADFAYRLRPRVRRDAARIHAILRRHADDAAIASAALWTGMLQTYRPIELELHAAIGALSSIP